MLGADISDFFFQQSLLKGTSFRFRYLMSYRQCWRTSEKSKHRIRIKCNRAYRGIRTIQWGEIFLSPVPSLSFSQHKTFEAPVRMRVLATKCNWLIWSVNETVCLSIRPFQFVPLFSPRLDPWPTGTTHTLLAWLIIWVSLFSFHTDRTGGSTFDLKHGTSVET